MIYIKRDFLDLENLLLDLDITNRKICIVTDDIVEKIYLEDIKRSCSKSLGVFSFSFKSGEESKNLDTVKDVYEYLLDIDFTRKDLLIALGGGVVGDLLGFVASTYMRGVDFISIPTSLLAMVDSSIGAKTGVDFLSYKNIIGSFYEPKFIYINIACLKSLEDIEFACGMSEVVKHALIRDKTYYEYILANVDLIKARDIDILEVLIKRSIEIKKDVVSLDPQEKGLRKILNFGHTLGHALEKYTGFKYKHGQAVAFGSLVAMYLSLHKSFIKEEEIYILKQVFDKLGINFNLSDIDIDELVLYTKKDKKRDNNSISFILLKNIGEAFIDNTVTEDDMKMVLRRLING